MTVSNNTVRYNNGTLKLNAGEIHFKGLKSKVSLERQIYTTDLRVLDNIGNAVKRARIYVDGCFAGASDENGKIPIRWKFNQPEAVIKFRGTETSGMLVPGEMTVQIASN